MKCTMLNSMGFTDFNSENQQLFFVWPTMNSTAVTEEEVCELLEGIARISTAIYQFYFLL